MTLRAAKTVFAALVTLPLVIVPALAAGGGGGGGGGGGAPAPTPTTQNCKNGEIWDKKKKKCVKAQSGLFDDDTLYEAARELAYAERYDEAIDILMLAADKNDPRILNYLGFSNRNAGRIEVGLGYYREALKRDPDYVLARSYMGQALVLIGDRVGAAVQLAEIEKRAGKDNWSYEALAAAIDKGIIYRH